MTIGTAADVRVLVVDDDPDHRFLAKRRLEGAGFDVLVAATADAALAEVPLVDLVLLDYRLPGTTGLDLLPVIAERGPSVVMVTGMGSEGLAVEAMRRGAVDYIVKDESYLDILSDVVWRAWLHHDLVRRAGELERIGLLVASASARPEVFAEVVEGARRLLRADGCVLFVMADAGLVQEAMAGDYLGDRDSVLSEARRLLAAPQKTMESPGRLLVPVPPLDETPLGVLAVLTRELRNFEPEERRIAVALASYAGIALGNLRRLELERALVAQLQHTIDRDRELAASVSHELRTPLTCVSGFAETLRAHWGALSDEERMMFVDKICHHSAELSDLVEHMLDYSQVEAGQLSAGICCVDLRTEVEATVAALGPLVAGRPLEIDVRTSAALADSALLRRTLTNLLSNAVKYSAPGTPIAVRTSAAGGVARVEVIDHGTGLTGEEADRAFDPFWRSSRVATNSLRGTGLGLSLVKEYVRVMGGDVSVDSEPGRGSTFTFTLPLPEALHV
ncbi:MAG TPA: ATP-binding protein [Acidimicrobiales bacterium]|jgi:signal transduction histidine kinase/ActR/RegA family two-component response regulator|nr:ATP-binding protein [Acidimicrobiales bacterium]